MAVAVLARAAHRLGAGSGGPATERLLGSFDALHFSDWMYPPQRAGVRATTIHDLVPLHHPEWTTARTRSMHGRKYRNAAETCDVVFVNSAYTGRDVTQTLGVPAERIRVAHPAPKGVYRVDGPAADLGAPYVLTVATLEPRKNLQVLVEAHRLLGDDLELVVVGGEGWGEQPLLDGPRIRRLGFVSDDELARLYRGATVVAYPLALRRLRDSRGGGDGVRRPRRRLRARVAGRGVRRLQRSARIPRIRPRSPQPSSARGSSVTSSRLAASSTPSGFSWRAVGEIFLRGYEEARA